MKKALLGIVVIAALAGGAALWLYQHHVIRSDRGLIVLPKKYWVWPDTWIDARAWTAQEYAQRPAVKRVLMEHGYLELVSVDPTPGDIERSLDELAAETEVLWLQFKQSARTWMNRRLEAANDYLRDCLAEK